MCNRMLAARQVSARGDFSGSEHYTCGQDQISNIGNSLSRTQSDAMTVFCDLGDRRDHYSAANHILAVKNKQRSISTQTSCLHAMQVIGEPERNHYTCMTSFNRLGILQRYAIHRRRGILVEILGICTKDVFMFNENLISRFRKESIDLCKVHEPRRNTNRSE